MQQEKKIPIIIPAYEPDERLLNLLRELAAEKAGPVILVNDGSGEAYKSIFAQASEILEKEASGVVLEHKINQGKGRALKTAFSYVLEEMPEAVGTVTADSDGQHTVSCICKIRDALLEQSDKLVLGVRTFDHDDIPWKSRFGNHVTEKVFSYVSGIHVSDTQTGLRGIPRAFMQELLDVKGERFEFEMRMLLETAGRYDIVEIPIETIYDSKENHQTHFHPVKDSIRIYKILGEKFIRYIFASFSSFLVDMVLFAVFCRLLKLHYPVIYVGAATVMARVVSAVYNYIINYKMVFRSKESVGRSGAKYVLLAVIQMACSAALVTLLVRWIHSIPEVVFKMVVDTILFFASYYIQQKYVFSKSKKEKTFSEEKL